MSTSESHKDDAPEEPGDRPRGSDPQKEQQIALAMAEYVDLLSSEVPVDVEHFCKRYPGLESEVKLEISTLQEFDGLTEDPASGYEDVAHEPPIEKLSGHRILSEIGSGGMGRVFLAIDERLGRTVAISASAARRSSRRAGTRRCAWRPSCRARCRR